MALAPRLTEWVAPWRKPDAVLRAVRGWVSGSAGNAGRDGYGCYVATADEQVIGLVTVGERTHFTGQVDAYVGNSSN